MFARAITKAFQSKSFTKFRQLKSFETSQTAALTSLINKPFGSTRKQMNMIKLQKFHSDNAKNLINKAKEFKVAVFSTQSYDPEFLDAVNERYGFSLTYHPTTLTAETALLVGEADAVCCFVHDKLDAQVLESLHKQGVRTVALRCSGFNHVDLEAAKQLGMEVTRVPSYSPEAVAEHAVGLIMTLNRRIHRAFNRVREGNFNLEGLLGFTLHGKTVGIVGTGNVGRVAGKILKGFGCKVLGYDPVSNPEFKKIGKEVSFEELLKESDIITLHCHLTPETHHIINKKALSLMKSDAMLVNTSRGGLIDTSAVLDALKKKKLGSLAIDVYEQESGIFFRDLSADIVEDDIFERLVTMPNVLVTSHQGFFTEEALKQISEITFANLACAFNGTKCENALVHRGKGYKKIEPLTIEIEQK